MSEIENMPARAGYQRVGLALGPAMAIIMMLLGAPEGLSGAKPGA